MTINVKKLSDVSYWDSVAPEGAEAYCSCGYWIKWDIHEKEYNFWWDEDEWVLAQTNYTAEMYRESDFTVYFKPNEGDETEEHY